MSTKTVELPGSIEPGSPVQRRPLALVRAHRWLCVCIGLVAVATLIVAIGRTRPSYDPYGWLVWGYQALRLHLDLAGAPSWKPMTFLFTFPYSLAGHFSLELWMVTAIAIALGGPVVAGRLVYKLVFDSTGERGPALVGAIGAGISLLAIVHYSRYWLSAQSDPMVVTFFLLWIDLHLHGRHRWAFGAIWMCALGRPEAWPFLLLYAAWAWRSQRAMRLLVVVGVLLVPLLWFGVPVLSGNSPFVSGDLDKNSPHMIHGNKISGTITRFNDLSFWPVRLAALAGLAIAAFKRDWKVLAIGGASVLWVIVEIAFALHGWSAAPRYMFEATGAMVVVAGVGVGWILTEAKRAAHGGRIAGVVAVLGLTAWLVPSAIAQVRAEQASLDHEHWRTGEIARLDATIAKLGGSRFIRSCGDPSTNVAWASILSWYMKENVSRTGFAPHWIMTGQQTPAVLFTSLKNGWEVRTFHIPAADQARCASLDGVTDLVTPQHPAGALAALGTG